MQRDTVVQQQPQHPENWFILDSRTSVQTKNSRISAVHQSRYKQKENDSFSRKEVLQSQS